MTPLEFPEVLRRELQREPPASRAVVLAVVDGEGWPHFSLVSFWEIVLDGPCLHLLLMHESRSAGMLGRSLQCTLGFYSPEGVFYIKANAEATFRTAEFEVFRLIPRQLKTDLPHSGEGAATFVTGLDFRLSPEALARRARTREAFRRQLECGSITAQVEGSGPKERT